MSTLGDLPPDQVRLWLHRVAGLVADYREKIEQRRVTPDVASDEIAAALPALAPEHGDKLAAIFEDVERFVVPGLVHAGHPKFLTDSAASLTAAGILGEWLAIALGGPESWAATALETSVLRWIRGALGLAEHFEGIVEPSGSAATLHALAAARDLAHAETRRRGLAGAPKLMLYTSGETDRSVEEAVITLGLGSDSIRRVETDGELRLRPAALRAAIARDVHARLRPFAVVASVGTPACGAVDPVPAIADVCAENALWLHVDASAGSALAVVPESRWVFDGVGRADSVVVGSHGWLFVPPGFTVLYTRRPELLGARPEAPGLAALKVWLAMRALGRTGLESRVREQVRLAQRFAEWVEADPDFELMAPVTMPVVCFRARPAGMADDEADQLNRRLVSELTKSGRVALGETRVGGGIAMRIAIGNALTREDHIVDVWTLIHDVFDRTLVD